MGARSTLPGLLAAAAFWLALPACVFPPWDERPDAGDDDDDDDATGQPSTIEALCEMADGCQTSPWSTVEQCVDEYPSYMGYCEDFGSFLVCAAACVELDCPDFIGCHDNCDEAHCWWL